MNGIPGMVQQGTGQHGLTKEQASQNRIAICSSESLQICLRKELKSALDQIYACQGDRGFLAKELVEYANKRCEENRVRPDDSVDLLHNEKLAFRTLFPLILWGLCHLYKQDGPNRVLIKGDLSDGLYVEKYMGGVILSHTIKGRLMDLETVLRNPLTAQPCTPPQQLQYSISQPQREIRYECHFPPQSNIHQDRAHPVTQQSSFNVQTQHPQHQAPSNVQWQNAQHLYRPSQHLQPSVVYPPYSPLSNSTFSK